MKKTLTASLSIAALAVNIQAMEVPKSNFDRLPQDLKIYIIKEATPNELIPVVMTIKKYCEDNIKEDYKFCTSSFMCIPNTFVRHPEIGIRYGIPLETVEYGKFYGKFDTDPYIDIYKFYHLPYFHPLPNREAAKRAIIRINNDTDKVLFSLKDTLGLKTLKNYRLVCKDFNRMIMNDIVFAEHIKPAQEAIEQESIAIKKKSSLLKKTKEKAKNFFDSIKK